MTTRSTNKLPTPGDAVLRYSYRKHSHEETASGVVAQNSGPAVDGGFYVTLTDDSVCAVDVYDTKRKEWIEKRPRFEGSPNYVKPNAKHKG